MNIKTCLLTMAMTFATMSAVAQEATIRKALGERIPQLSKIDEVTKSPIAGLYEIRVGTEILYSDAEGNFLVQGELIDTKTRRNITEERIEKLTAIDFNALPVKDAFTIVRGTGKRKIAVFEDPNCGYCKRFERDLANVKDVTIHMFLYPILSPDSAEKSKSIWCSKDRAKTWQDYMVRDIAVPSGNTDKCDTTALTRNTDFGRKHKITGTPTVFFADGSRIPGAINAQQMEKMLAEVKTN